MSLGKVERSIYYYDLEINELDEQEKKFKPVNNYENTVIELFNFIKEHPISETEIKIPEGNKLYILVDDIDYSNKTIHYRLVLVKTDAFPLVEWEGNLQSLNDFLDNNQNIAEITHSVLFWEYGIIGSEYNFSGARATAVSKIITAILRDNDRYVSCNCRYKLDKNVYEKIISGKDYSLFDLAVKTNTEAYSKLRKGESFLSSMFKNAPGDLDIVEIVLKKKKNIKYGDDGFEEVLTKEEIVELLRNNRDDFKRFKICQEESITRDSVDLLADKLIEKKTFIKTSNKQISSKEMYNSIIKFFNNTVIKQCKSIINNL